jgi:hypothetical protein
MGGKDRRTGTVYRIVARSALEDRYASAFDGMHVHSAEGRTVLTGEVEGLYGVLEHINDVGLQLVSVQILAGEARQSIEEDDVASLEP